MKVYVVKSNGEHLDQISGVFDSKEAAEAMINGNPDARAEEWDVEASSRRKFRRVYRGFINLFSGRVIESETLDYWDDEPMEDDFTTWKGVVMFDRSATHATGLSCQVESTVSREEALRYCQACRLNLLSGDPIVEKHWTSEAGFRFAYKDGLDKQILILITGARHNVCIYPEMAWNHSLENFARQGWKLRPVLYGSEEFNKALEEQGWTTSRPRRQP